MNNNDIKKYCFSEKVAVDVGLEEAIMLYNICFWVNHNERKEYDDHFHEEKYWMYGSITYFTEQYPYWTASMVRRILSNLKKKDYIKTGRFNKYGYDKTTWYTITEKALNALGSMKNNEAFAEIDNLIGQE